MHSPACEQDCRSILGSVSNRSCVPGRGRGLRQRAALVPAAAAAVIGSTRAGATGSVITTGSVIAAGSVITTGTVVAASGSSRASRAAGPCGPPGASGTAGAGRRLHEISARDQRRKVARRNVDVDVIGRVRVELHGNFR